MTPSSIIVIPRELCIRGMDLEDRTVSED
jgi:hypothetical protein